MNSADIEKIELQKMHYKMNGGSICTSCFNVDKDCFETLKMTEKAKNNNFSRVVKCNRYNKELVFNYTENTVKVQAESDTRIESMGGGFQNVDKYN